MKTMLILGRDRIARSLLNELQKNNDLIVIIDKSTSVKRIARLILKKRLSVFLFIKMLICEFSRRAPSVPISSFSTIKSNKDLLDIIEKFNPERIILFRAGLVISKDVIARGIPLMNVHCANVPEYGGLGSIHRAISDKAVCQNATLHQVTTTIDEGKIWDAEPFQLSLNKSYCFNEEVAYQAGLRLLRRTIGQSMLDS